MELQPQSLSQLLRRARREAATGSVFDLPIKKMWTGPKSTHDVSRDFHGETAANGVGPAAGPHTQLAQNIALSYLAGARVQELKTVQIMDELDIPRPCIDAANIAFNVEWSQELKIQQSTVEYAKAALLIAGLQKMGIPEGLDVAAHGKYLLDLSVGYDLKGIESPQVSGFIRHMMNAGPVLKELLDGLDEDLSEFKDLQVDPQLVSCVTLSTFHGCPADEIEHIAEYLLKEMGLHVVVKLNPTLLGFETVNSILRDKLGYTDLTLDPHSFETDLQWPQALEMITRLRQVALQCDRHFGVKLTNTLVVNNHKDFFPASEKQMYMSGQALHVISSQLYAKIRRAIPQVGEGQTPPIMYTFSAGIDQHNFPTAAAADLCPVTTCTDLLRPGGYARLPKYLDKLEAKMKAVSARTVQDYILRAHGHAGPALLAIEALIKSQFEHRGWAVSDGLSEQLQTTAAKAAELPHLEALSAAGFEAAQAELIATYWRHEAGTMNAETMAEMALEDPRYTFAKNAKVPKKIGSHLALFDCVSCDKCVPVCPNDANFVYDVAPVAAAAPVWSFTADAVETKEDLRLEIEQSHQLSTFVDFCNACGNCDIFCPEDGGPYQEKPHWFGSKESFEAETKISGLYLEGRDVIAGKFGGRSVRLSVDRSANTVRFEDEGISLQARLDPEAPCVLEHKLADGTQSHSVPSGDLFILRALLDGVQSTVNPISAALV